MNKKVLFLVLGIILLIAGAFSYVLFVPKDEPAKETPAKTAPDTSPTPQTVQEKPGTYIEYSEASVASTAGTKLLFFHAPWCPQCRELEASINKGGVPSGVTVFKVDYDSNQALRQKYGVTIQTSFVKIDDSGNKLASYVAYEEPQFSNVRRELLP